MIECTGAPPIVLDVIEGNSPSGVVCLTGVSSGGRNLKVDVGTANRHIVLENDVIFGSVNANRAHYEAAVSALSATAPRWLAGVITRRVPLESWLDALDPDPHDVKVVVDLM